MKQCSILLLFLFFSCTKKLVDNQTTITVEDTKEEIFFLNGFISSKLNQFELSRLEVQRVDGKLKINDKNHIVKTGDLEIIQYDQNKKILGKNYITNPLLLELEYVDEADKFARKVQELKEADFTLRFQKQLGTCFLTITRIDLTKNTQSNLLHHELCNQ
jgi:hypothetical protein